MARRVTAQLVLLTTALLCLGAAPKQGADKSESDFWMNIAQPGRKQYQAALRKGRDLYEAAVRSRSPGRARSLEEALAAFQQAIRHSPAAAEGYYWLGKAAYALDRMKEVLTAFNTMRRLQPDFGDEFGVCFKLGIAYSKLGRFEEAVQEYNRAERALMNDSSRNNDRSVMHSNAAESLMAMGRLDEAIQRYQESVVLQPANVLGWWGLAVAYDRDEQVSKAKEAVNRALTLDPSISKLTDDGVFFVPDGDIHYYFALGYHVKGDGPRAKKEWEGFIAKLPKSQWTFRARQHLAELGAAPSAPKTKRLAPFPKVQGPGPVDSDSIASDQNVVRSRIQGSLYRVRQCYQKELKQSPTVAGQLRLGVTISKDGKIQEVKVLSSTVKRPSLHSCVLSTVKTISFNKPSSGVAIKITFPMEFKPVIQ